MVETDKYCALEEWWLAGGKSEKLKKKNLQHITVCTKNLVWRYVLWETSIKQPQLWHNYAGKHVKEMWKITKYTIPTQQDRSWKHFWSVCYHQRKDAHLINIPNLTVKIPHSNSSENVNCNTELQYGLKWKMNNQKDKFSVHCHVEKYLPKGSQNQKLQNQTSSNIIFTAFVINCVHSNMTYVHSVKQKSSI